jgi:hypothetical protein
MGLRELLISCEKILFQFLEDESKNVLAGAASFSELIQIFDSFGRQEEQGKGHRTSRMKSFTQSMTLSSRPSSLPSIERTYQ